MSDPLMSPRGRDLGGWIPLLGGLGIGFLLPVLLPTVFVFVPLVLLVLGGPLLLLGFAVVLIAQGIAIYRRRGESAGETAAAVKAIVGGIVALVISLYLASSLLCG